MVKTSLTETLQELKSILLEEKEALIKNEGQLIQEIVSKKEALAERLEEAEVADEEKAEVRELVLEIKNLQETNAMLTKQAIQYTETFVSAFQKVAQKSSTYSKEGNLEKSNRSGLLDQSL